jgi:HD-GYP domain-containing protein (c-di-GMP phosphodiesterase class II)
LPLRLPDTHEQSSLWECTGCGKSYRGILLESWPAEFRQNVRPAASQSEREAAPVLREAAPDVAVAPDERHQEPIATALLGRRETRCELETVLSRQLDLEIELGVNLKVPPQGTPFAKQMRRHGVQPYQERTVQRFQGLIHHASGQLGDLFSALRLGKSAQLRVTESISQDGLSRVAEDRDLLLNLGISLSSDDYPSQHALRVSTLAMSIGATLGWDERTLLDLGIGCLIHDLGMLRIDCQTYLHKRTLSDSDYAEIAKHPLLTFELLQQHLDRIPSAARMVAYQIHERCDGTGYPRGYSRVRIHSLARIAAVADTFVTLISQRPHGPGMIPYDAVKKILYDTKDGLFDPEVVRGLLNTVSLFPISSYVKLNDGRLGTVIRSTGKHYVHPIVEVWGPGDPPAKADVVDLSAQPEVNVASALARPGS